MKSGSAAESLFTDALEAWRDQRRSTAAESLFIDALEAWRISLGIDRLVVFGHSFGGYIATCYALRYPQSVSGLILNDPWGFPSPEPEKAK
ncbi:Alpha/Beta hydrolase protein, partial [Baffinella frigidus]